MEKWKEFKLDDESMWPKTGIVEMDKAHIDERGSIQSIVNFPMKNISIISSKKGSVRSKRLSYSRRWLAEVPAVVGPLPWAWLLPSLWAWPLL